MGNETQDIYSCKERGEDKDGDKDKGEDKEKLEEGREGNDSSKWSKRKVAQIPSPTVFCKHPSFIVYFSRTI